MSFVAVYSQFLYNDPYTVYWLSQTTNAIKLDLFSEDICAASVCFKSPQADLSHFKPVNVYKMNEVSIKGRSTGTDTVLYN